MWTKESVLEHNPPIPVRIYFPDGSKSDIAGRIVKDGANPFVVTRDYEKKFSWGAILGVLNDAMKTERLPIDVGHREQRPATPVSLG